MDIPMAEAKVGRPPRASARPWLIVSWICPCSMITLTVVAMPIMKVAGAIWAMERKPASLTSLPDRPLVTARMTVTIRKTAEVSLMWNPSMAKTP